MRIFIVGLILSFIVQAVQKNQTIHLYTHRWCYPCKKANAIFNKISATFPEIQFRIHKYTNRTILFQNTTLVNPKPVLPFPTIIVQCSDKKFTYQNDLSFSQLSYWINVSCMTRIPACTMKINQQLYHIAIKQPEQQNISNLIQSIQRHPHIKVCLSSNSNKSSTQVRDILELSDSKTLYFDYFSHSIRNYLIQSTKFAIALITSKKNTTKVNSFFSAFISLENYMGEKPPNKTTNIYRFQLTQYQKQQLIFLQLCLNKNSSMCLMDSSRKAQVQSSQKVTKKLIKFLQIPFEEGSDMDYVVAFRFNHPYFEKYIYHYSLGQLDQKFIFWINNILQSQQKVSQEQNICHGNIITHRVSRNSLQDIQTHSYLAQRLKDINKSLQKPYYLNKVVKGYSAQPKITVCKAQKLPVHYWYNRQIQAALDSLNQSIATPFSNDL